MTLHARAFGRVEGAVGTDIALSLMTAAEAAKYTVGTLGTSGTKGITAQNISVPQGAIDFEPKTVTVGADGTAAFELTSSNPGNPRVYVDGQVYFIQYTVQGVNGYVQDPDDLISVQIYQDIQIKDPAWENGVAEILAQFGQLYPVMAKFGLRDHASVKKNADMIRRVLELDFEQPLHMPVTRDLSESRRNIILNWMDNGTP